MFRRFLKKQGLKFTTERAVTLDAVLARDGVFEAEELLVELQQSHPDHKVSKATVYRTLKHLLEAGIIAEVLLDSTRAHYQLAYGRPNVGHLVDVEGDAIHAFPTDELQELADRICAEHGLDPVSYRFVVYGAKPESK